VLAFLFEILADILGALGLPMPRWMQEHERAVWIILIAILGALFLVGAWRFGFSSWPPS